MKHRFRSDRGQAFVEFVIVLPLLFALVFLIAYAGVGFTRYLKVTDAARIAARAAATARFTNETPCDAATSAANNAVDGLPITVSCSPAAGPWNSGDDFSVTVEYTLNVTFPFLPSASVPMSSTVQERLE